MKTYILIWVVAVVLSIPTQSEPLVQLSLGHGIRHQQNSVSEIFLTVDNWSVSMAGISKGETENGYQDFNNIFSVTKKQTWFWGDEFTMYTRVGVSTVEGSNLVGPWNYRSGVGAKYKAASIEYHHISSASLYRTNQGIDWISFSIDF